MTEAEWLACADVGAMLAVIHKTASERKLRLFACACCRSVGSLVDQTRYGGQAVAAAERMADGLPTEGLLPELYDDLWYEGFAWIDGYRHEKENQLWYHTTSACLAGIEEGSNLRDAQGRFPPYDAAFHAAFAVATSERRGDDDPASKEVVRRELATYAGTVREIFGNPFRAVIFDPRWLTPDVVSLSQAAHDERTLPTGELNQIRLSVLADALEDAGCTDADLLTHLRSPGPHVRGCWALDLLLGKS
jgi:hypothetical protein